MIRRIGFMKVVCVVGLTGIIALVGAMQVSADGEQSVPFAAALSGTAEWDGGPVMTCQGEGIASHLGRTVSQCTSVLDLANYQLYAECAGEGTGFGIPNINTVTLTAADGDRLVLVSVDLACEIVQGTSFHGTGLWTVDAFESTGRFAGATGTGNLDGKVDFSTGDVMVNVTGEIAF